MAAGRKQDMKAIWDVVYIWEVSAQEENGHDREFLNFYKAEVGKQKGWEGTRLRAGLLQIIEMSTEEWLEEARPIFSEFLLQ